MLKLEVATSEKTRPHPTPAYSGTFPCPSLQWARRKRHHSRRQRPPSPSAADSQTPSPYRHSRTPSPYHAPTEGKTMPSIRPHTHRKEASGDDPRGSGDAAGQQDDAVAAKAVIAAYDDGNGAAGAAAVGQDPPAEGRSLRRRAAAVARPRRVELWVGLSREEIEEDYYSITGAKLPRRPKRRPKPVPANLLDRIFPGAWLPNTIIAEIYKVHEPGESKRRC